MKKITLPIAFFVLPLFFGMTARAAHPPIALLDQNGKDVLETGRPISTLQSCNHCHDTPYIASHSNHHSFCIPGQTALLGPAESQKADDVEMNCFLCHIARPDNQTRVEELQKGRFLWASTATLASTNLVHPTPEGWTYERAAFLPNGRLEASKLGLGPAKNDHCALCHGLIDSGKQPLKLDLSLQKWSTASRGEVFSPQRLCESAVNFQDKGQLSRSWDVHAERLLQCNSCHYSNNNPAFYEPAPENRPKHLAFEPRRLTWQQYLKQPNHQFVAGHISHGTPAGHADGKMRQCADCHRAAESHKWLPFQETHFAKLSCEACHIPQLYAPAVRQVDWTLLTASGEPQVQWRGINGEPADPMAEVTGFHPALLPERNFDGKSRLIPHNLITVWYWVAGGDKPHRVELPDLKTAMIENGQYHPDIARMIGNGSTRLDTPEKIEVVRRRLESVGVVKPRIAAEIQPYGIHHGVAAAKGAIRKCETCHSPASRLGEQFTLASYLPGGVVPQAIREGTEKLNGALQISDDGKLMFEPSMQSADIYVLGYHHWPWVNWLGGFSLVTVTLGVVIHASLRMGLSGKKPKAKKASASLTPTKDSSPS